MTRTAEKAQEREAASAPRCRHCGHADVAGPFTMDGIVDGRYRDDYRWIVCRSCNRSTWLGES